MEQEQVNILAILAGLLWDIVSWVFGVFIWSYVELFHWVTALPWVTDPKFAATELMNLVIVVGVLFGILIFIRRNAAAIGWTILILKLLSGRK